MTMKFTRAAYRKIIEEDRAWLLRQPDTLERSHIDAIVVHSEQHEYDTPETIHQLTTKLKQAREWIEGAPHLKYCYASVKLADGTYCKCVCGRSRALAGGKVDD